MIYASVNESPLALPARKWAKKDVPKNGRYTSRIAIYIGRRYPEITKTLYSLGYTVINAEDSSQGVQHLLELYRNEGLTPEIIIVERENMAETGNSFLETLNRIGEFRAIPLIAVTGENSGVASVVRHHSIDDMISSGITENQLQDKIRLLRKFRQLKMNYKTERTPTSAKNRQYTPGRFFKRIVDILVAGCILVVLSPVLLFIMIIIRLDSKGPIFYVSLRAGNGYKVFRFYKFRTMVADADKKLREMAHLNQYNTDKGEGAVFIKVNNDPRVTRVGAFLRKTSLDELPQFFNILKGDMSLVGNRPLPLYEAITLTTDQWAERFLAPAGLTGLWQITRRGKKHMSVNERINLDIDYAHKNSFLYDLWIILNTPSSIIQKENV